MYISDSVIKKLFSHTALYGLAPQIPKVASIIVLPILTRHLTDVDYGVAGIITAYTGALGVLQALGMNIILANSYYKQPGTYKWLWRQVHGFISLWSVVYGLLLGAILYAAMPEEAYEHRWLVVLLNVLPPTLFSTTQMIVFRHYQMSGKPLPLAIRSVVLGLVAIALNLYFIAELELGYLGWFLSSFVSSALSFLVFGYLIYFKVGLTPIFNFKWRLIKSTLRVALPTVPHYYSSYLLDSSDRLVMDWLKTSTANLGLYNFAGNFGGYFSTLGNAIGLAVGPMYNKLYKQGERDSSAYYKARALTFFVQGGFLLGSFLVCLWMKEILYILVSNAELQTVYPLAIVIVMGYAYRPMYLGAGAQLFYHEKTKNLWKISFIGGVSNVLLNLLLIPTFGYQAAALTTFVSLMYMGYSAYFMKDYKAIKKLNYYPLVWLTLTCVVAAASYLAKDIDLWFKVGITFAVLISSLLVFFKSNFKSLLDEQE